MKNLTHKRNFSSTASKLKPDLLVVPAATAASAATLARFMSPFFAVLIGSASFYFGLFHTGDVSQISSLDYSHMTQYIGLVRLLNTVVIDNFHTLNSGELAVMYNNYLPLVYMHTEGASAMHDILREYNLNFIDPQVYNLRYMSRAWMSVGDQLTYILATLGHLYWTNL